MITGNSDGALVFRPEMMDPSASTGLWWCATAEDAQAVGTNAVCLSLLAKWSDLEPWKEWVEQFPYILLAVPPGQKQEEIAEELQNRFFTPVMVPKPKAFRGCATLKELWDNGRFKAMDKLLMEAEELPVQGLLNLADVDTTKRKNARRVVSGIPELDKAIGGFSGGALSVWTGKRGEGKSTLLGQILLDAVNQGRKVCAYSGELPKEDFKMGLLQQAAGYLHVKRREDAVSGRVFYDIAPSVLPAINAWWDGRLFLTDIQRKDAHDEENIMKIFEYAYRRYGCDVFLVDNIMTAELKDEAQLGFWRAQSSFTGRLVAFAKRLDVHVHLVAHPRKTGDKPLEADDIGGSSDITNRADNVFKVERVPEDKVGEAGYSSLLTILKNREFGARARIGLEYNEPSKRLYQAGRSPAKQYSWEMMT